jgi:molybdopterin-synthase adenylyltransferase
MSDASPSAEFDPALARYSRQMLFAPIGEKGQKRLRLSQVTLVGCGALGTVLANTLVRAGLGSLRIIDRDYVEMDNLQRQVLFDESDVGGNLPKAEAASRKLRRINSAVEVEPFVADVTPANIDSLCRDADLILDGTDNFETRFLINDFAVKNAMPWVYGACVAAEGLVLPILPRRTPCLRCVWDEAPPPGMTQTCDTAGVLSPLVNIVASLQALEALKLLTGNEAALNLRLMTIDAWAGRVRALDMQSAYDDGNCVCCKQGRYEYLEGGKASGATTLCGRDAVQITPAQPPPDGVDFRRIADGIRSGRPTYNEFLLRFSVAELTVTVFRDGRAIVKGTRDPAAARSVYSRFVGG